MHPSYQIAFVSMLQKLLQEAKRKLGEILSAFEFLDSQSMNLVISCDTLMKLICVMVASYKCLKVVLMHAHMIKLDKLYV